MGRICKNTEPPPFHSVSISVEPSYQLRTYLPATLSRYQTFLFSLSLYLPTNVYIRLSLNQRCIFPYFSPYLLFP